MSKEKKLLEIVREKIRVRHYSLKTERSYVGWIKRYIFFHGLRHPKEMGKREIEAFLTSLAVDGNVAPATQNQAFDSLLFLYEQVLDISLREQKNRGQVIVIVLSSFFFTRLMIALTVGWES